MLTRIEIDGFKTFKDFALDVPPFLVVLGQNAAGKSNLFDALAFLARLAKGEPAMQAVREARGGLYGLLHQNTSGDRVDTLRFAVELTTDSRDLSSDGSRQRVRYELTLRVHSEDPSDPQGTQALLVVDERVSVTGASVGRSVGSSGGSGSSGWVELDYVPMADGLEDEGTSRRYPAGRILRPAVTLTVADGTASRVPSGTDSVVRQIRRELASWRVLALEPSALRRSDTFEDEDRLSSSGGHLPNTLSRIVRNTRREDRPNGALSDIAADLGAVIPDVIGLRLDEDRVRRVRTVLVRTKGQTEYPAALASDGTLRALALVAALRDPQEPGLLCLEEPENGIYPVLLARFVRRVLEWTRKASTPAGSSGASGRQVILSSHSPAVLAALPPASQPLRDDVVLLDLVSRTSDRGGSRVSRARRIRTGAPLGEASAGPVVSLAELDAFLGREAAQ